MAGLLLVLLGGCGESLPTRIVPPGALAIDRVLVGQGTGDGGIEITVNTFVRNNYEETFAGAVDVDGSVRIWWKDRPDVVATIPLVYRDDVRLAPGAAFRIPALWLLQADDGRDVLSLLDYSTHDIRYGIEYARPETFVLEVRMTVFEETGLLLSGPVEFSLQGWRREGEVDP